MSHSDIPTPTSVLQQSVLSRSSTAEAALCHLAEQIQCLEVLSACLSRDHRPDLDPLSSTSSGAGRSRLIW